MWWKIDLANIMIMFEIEEWANTGEASVKEWGFQGLVKCKRVKI